MGEPRLVRVAVEGVAEQSRDEGGVADLVRAVHRAELGRGCDGAHDVDETRAAVEHGREMRERLAVRRPVETGPEHAGDQACMGGDLSQVRDPLRRCPTRQDAPGRSFRRPAPECQLAAGLVASGQRRGAGLMTDESADATAIWDKRYAGDEHVGTRPVIEGDPIDYTQHKFLYERAVAIPMTGAPDGYNLERVGQKFLTPPPARMLALGVGMAFTEEYIIRNNFAGHITAYEMSAQAVERARTRFAEAGLADRIELRAADVLDDDLPDASFDVVFVQAAIHHFDRIEEMFRLMHRVLRPGGLLVYDEYVGPDHHMYHERVMGIIDEVDACLAPCYRHDHLAGRLREGLPPPSLPWMLQHDPSEGVHASRTCSSGSTTAGRWCARSSPASCATSTGTTPRTGPSPRWSC